MRAVTLKKILTAAISLLLVIYVVCNLYISKIKKISSETIIYSETYDSYETNAYIIKNESVINSDFDKNIYYILKDGENISAGGTVAYEFENHDDIRTKEEISKLQKKISDFQDLNIKAQAYTSNPENIDQKISRSLNTFRTLSDNGDLLQLNDKSSEILYFLNNKQLAIGKVTDFTSIITQAQDELKQLENNLNDSTKAVKSDISGYFVSSIDGYENKANYKNIENVKFSDLDKIMSDTKEDDSEAIGKTIGGLNWYVVCELPVDETVNLYKDKQITINFPLISNENIPVAVASINKYDNNSNATVVLRCSYMTDELINLRKEQVKINFDAYDGLRVPKSAVHLLEVKKKETGSDGKETEISQTVQGVYTIFGSQLKFKEINPIYSYSDFLICNKDTEDKNLFTGDTIKLYDEVIIQGEDLYDGKIIK